jgi:hypothetical protein
MKYPQWQSQAEGLLRAVCPDLDGRPLYLLTANDIHSRTPDYILGWTGRSVETIASEHLGSKYRGPGFAAILWSSRFDSWQSLMGGCLHELAHWIDAPPEPERAENKTSATAIADCALDQMELLQKLKNEIDWKVPAWIGHEMRFVRACCHLAARANRLCESIRPSHLRFGNDYFPHPFSESIWVSSLQTELSYRGSIRELLDTEPPASFTKIYKQATTA